MAYLYLKIDILSIVSVQRHVVEANVEIWPCVGVFLHEAHAPAEKSFDLAIELTPHDCSGCSIRNVHYGFNGKAKMPVMSYMAQMRRFLCHYVSFYSWALFSSIHLLYCCRKTAKECACTAWQLGIQILILAYFSLVSKTLDRYNLFGAHLGRTLKQSKFQCNRIFSKHPRIPRLSRTVGVLGSILLAWLVDIADAPQLRTEPRHNMQITIKWQTIA